MEQIKDLQNKGVLSGVVLNCQLHIDIGFKFIDYIMGINVIGESQFRRFSLELRKVQP